MDELIYQFVWHIILKAAVTILGVILLTFCVVYHIRDERKMRKKYGDKW